jgi:hypothetical protein
MKNLSPQIYEERVQINQEMLNLGIFTRVKNQHAPEHVLR